MRTIECPNCGAPATNMQNCNFCGSLLVRFADKGIDLSKTKYINNETVIPGLINELEKNLSLQESVKIAATDLYCKTNGETKNFCFVTSASMIGFLDNELAFPNSNGISLATCFTFDIYNDASIDPIEIERHNRFKTLASFPLFTSHTSSCIDNKGNTFTAYEYAIDFGKDVEGTARLISEVVSKVFGLDTTQPIDCYTDDFDKVQEHRRSLGLVYQDESGTNWKKWIWIGIAIVAGLISLML